MTVTVVVVVVVVIVIFYYCRFIRTVIYQNIFLTINMIL